MADAGLYIHIPFCRTKCGYCAFNSRPWPGAGPADYLAAVTAELRQAVAGWAREQTFTTLFIGGGTPTIYDGRDLAALLADCRQLLVWRGTPEVTVETNPNTLSPACLDALRAAGVNRLSIGVQALDDRLLAAIGRSHDRTEAMAAVTMARAAGFTNLNLDLIYGLPGQTPADWHQTLATALALGPEHLALYELSVEPGTAFASREAHGELALPDDEAMAEMEAMAQALLPGHGYERYEISNYARPGQACRHNLNYWQNGSYLGLGVGAVSCFDGLRLKNIDEPAAYQARIHAGQPALQEGEALGLAASFRESVIMGLRLIDGVSIAALRQRYGLEPASYYGPTLARLIDRGLLVMDDERLWLTATALPVAHQVLAELV